MTWKTKDSSYENTAHAQFDIFFEDLFEKARFLDILRNFICFNVDGEKRCFDVSLKTFSALPFISIIYSLCSSIRNEVVLLSKRKILDAVLLALSVLLTALQSTDKEGKKHA